MATVAPFGPATRLSRDALRRALDEGQRRARGRGRPILVSLAEAAAGLDPLAVFTAGLQLAAAPLYWEACTPAGERLALAGAGAAHTITADGPRRFAAVASAWRDLLDGAVIVAPSDPVRAGPLLLGGAGFDPLRPRAPIWQAFPDALYILPRFVMARGDAGDWLTTNVVVHPGEDCDLLAEATLRAWAELRAAGRRCMDLAGPGVALPPHPPADTLVEDRPSALEWQEMVADVAREIREGRFAKVVLARQARLHLLPATAPERAEPAPAGPERVRGAGIGARAVCALASLRRSYPTSFLFAIARPSSDGKGDAIFLGASPERLVRLREGMVEATCLAGSIRRGATAEEDTALGSALLASTKDGAEHAVVARMLREALSPLCPDLAMPSSPSLLRLANVQHLYTPIRGQLANGHGILDLVERLHPTPAVGGYPGLEALRAIREREPFDRGWYAAPVGWLDARQEGEFAVAIRSALLRDLPAGPEALLFAGCGIMGDSDPAVEYQESRLKMRAMLGALGG
jgi:isochorismate synthase EntC